MRLLRFARPATVLPVRRSRPEPEPFMIPTPISKLGDHRAPLRVRRRRSKYAAALPRLAPLPLDGAPEMPATRYAFSGRHDLPEQIAGPGPEVEFLEDCYPSRDDRLLRGPEEKRAPANSGFVLVRTSSNWETALARFAAVTGEPAYLTEQTLFHLAVHASRGRTGA